MQINKDVHTDLTVCGIKSKGTLLLLQTMSPLVGIVLNLWMTGPS